MPSTSIGGCSLHYQVLGQGEPIVLTPGGREALERVLPLAEKLSAGFRVIVWDRSNLGSSDICFSAASDIDLWCDQLYGLLQALDARPAFLAAASSGARISLRMALRYPEAVRGLFLWLLTGGPVAKVIAQMYYGEPAQAAEQGGMEAVCALPYWVDRIRANPANRQRLMAEDPVHFAAVMRRWAAQMREDDLLVGVTEQDMHRIATPIRIVAGADDYGHRRDRMEIVAAALPAAELIDPPGFREEWLAIKEKADTGTGYELVSQLPELVGAFVRERCARPAEARVKTSDQNGAVPTF